LRFLALAGTFEGLPDDVRAVRVLLHSRTDPFEATSSDRAWIVLLPAEELHQDGRLAGEIIWHDGRRRPYRRRALRSLRALRSRGEATRSETGGTGYGPPIAELDLPPREERG
jgi:hypothetical protein